MLLPVLAVCCTLLQPLYGTHHDFHTIEQIGKFCATIVNELIKQPIFTGTEDCIVATIQLLPLEATESRIVELIHENAEKTLPSHKFSIAAFDRYRNIRSAGGDLICSGIRRITGIKDINKNISPHTADKLHEMYQKITRQISTGWELTDYQQHPALSSKPKDPPDYYLLIKESQLNDESKIIRNLISLFKIKQCDCGNSWTEKSSSKDTQSTYFWIHKKAYARVKEAFQLTIPANKITAFDEQEAKQCHSTFPLVSLSDQLITSILAFNTTPSCLPSSLKAWHKYGLINKKLNMISNHIMSRSINLHLGKTGEYALFRQTMQVRKIARNVARSLQRYDDDDDLYIQLGEQDLPSPNPQHHQTDKGLFLRCSSSPSSLHTPWGDLSLYRSISCNYESQLTQQFLKHFSLQFHSLLEPWSGSQKDVKYYLINLTDLITHQNPSELLYRDRVEDMSVPKSLQYQGKPVLIHGSCSGYDSALTIDKIGKDTVEPATYKKRENFRSDGLTLKLWDIMLGRYRREKELPLGHSIL